MGVIQGSERAWQGDRQLPRPPQRWEVYPYSCREPAQQRPHFDTLPVSAKRCRWFKTSMAAALRVVIRCATSRVKTFNRVCTRSVNVSPFMIDIDLDG